MNYFSMKNEMKGSIKDALQFSKYKQAFNMQINTCFVLFITFFLTYEIFLFFSRWITPKEINVWPWNFKEQFVIKTINRIFFVSLVLLVIKK